MLYYELLRLNETVTANHYQRQLRKLSKELMQKRSSVANNQRKVILLHDSTRPHVTESRHFYNLNGKSSRIQRILQTLSDPSFPIDATCTYGHILVQS